MRPSDHTISVVQAHGCWAVAATYSISVEVIEPGTRSQRMRFTVTVLDSTISSELPSPWTGEQYAADSALLRDGASFLVIMVCDRDPDGSSSWKIVQADELGDTDPTSAVAELREEISRALDRE